MQDSFFVPILTLIITSVVSVITITLAKESKISEFRKAWIDSFVEELSHILAAVKALSVFIDTIRKYGKNYLEQTCLNMDEKLVSELRYKASENLYKIKLKLNPADADQSNLKCSLDELAQAVNFLIEFNGELLDVQRAIDDVTIKGNKVLDNEWEKVKKGETWFCFIRYAAISIFFLAIVFLLLHFLLRSL
ncbi:MAG: hypothetical protein WC782_01555 [Methylococcaceae bacterium]|jgi:hypothetical protein